MFTISREGVQDANRDGLLGANRSNSLAIARICNNADRPIPRLHTRVEIVNTLLQSFDGVVHVGIDAQLTGDFERLFHNLWRAQLGVCQQRLGR